MDSKLKVGDYFKIKINDNDLFLYKVIAFDYRWVNSIIAHSIEDKGRFYNERVFEDRVIEISKLEQQYYKIKYD